MAAKTETALVEINKRLADAQAVLRVLEDGRQDIEREMRALQVEGYLRQGRLEKSHRAFRAELQQLRKTMRGAQPAPAVGDVPGAVVIALKLLRGDLPPNLQLDRNAARARLEANHAVVSEAICAQQPIVDELKSERGATRHRLRIAEWNALVLKRHRAAQAFAASQDEIFKFQSSITSEGDTWRADLLPEPAMRAALVLGSESDFNSELSRARRTLEELKIL